MKKIISAFGLLMLSAGSAMAAAGSGATVADIANNVNSQIDLIPELLGGMSYVFGIVLGIKGILKLKENNESKGQVKLGIPIAMLVASALFLGLPSFIKTGGNAIFGEGAAQTGPASSRL